MKAEDLEEAEVVSKRDRPSRVWTDVAVYRAVRGTACCYPMDMSEEEWDAHWRAYAEGNLLGDGWGD